MYAVTPLKSPPNSAHIDDEPITTFHAIIETVPVEQWQKRTNALRQLVAEIPNEIMDVDTEWYNSPKYLRHLAIPLSELLKDARSSVVIRTCDSCIELFDKVGSDARYLLKDIMPTILGVHAQTVQIIRNAVLEMVMTSLPRVPCKSVMPLWLERLKQDKSRTVREACAAYLSLALESWTEEGYLTTDIRFQVGASLILALRDASPAVRTEAKRGVEQISQSQPEVWHRLLHDPEGPAAKDPKLRQYLLRVSNDESCEDLSITSRGSFASHHRQMFPPRHHVQTTRRAPSVPSAVIFDDGSQARSACSSKRSGLGPPMRINNSVAMESPRRKPRNSPQRYKVGSPRRTYTPEMKRQASGDHLDMMDTPPKGSPVDIVTAGTLTTVDTATEDEAVLALEQEGPYITSFDELRKHATERRSRRSSILQERLRTSSSLRSSSILVESEQEEETPTDPAPSSSEHLQIAQQLLEAHRIHVDKVMETLRLEMDALKDFEQLLLDESRPSRPSEGDVLDYFESVGLCLDQRTASGKVLQREMDRISKGVS